MCENALETNVDVNIDEAAKRLVTLRFSNEYADAAVTDGVQRLLAQTAVFARNKKHAWRTRRRSRNWRF